MQITFQLGAQLLSRESHISSQQRSFSPTFVNEKYFLWITKMKMSIIAYPIICFICSLSFPLFFSLPKSIAKTIEIMRQRGTTESNCKLQLGSAEGNYSLSINTIIIKTLISTIIQASSSHRARPRQLCCPLLWLEFLNFYTIIVINSQYWERMPTGASSLLIPYSFWKCETAFKKYSKYCVFNTVLMQIEELYCCGCGLIFMFPCNQDFQYLLGKYVVTNMVG